MGKVSESAIKARHIVDKAMAESYISPEDYDMVVHLISEDGHIDKQEAVIFAHLNDMINDGTIKRVKKKTDDCKQVIVMRKDLNMRKGKMIAQGSHASLGALLTLFSKSDVTDDISYTVSFKKNGILDKWLNGIFTKICVEVNSESELLEIYDKVKQNPEMPVALIKDSGKTEFNGVPTLTCLCIGPHLSSEIDKYTGHLKLL